MKNVALIYPNKFKGGISCLAMHILYYHLNKYHDINCNMYFIENYEEIRNNNAIIITLQYENDYFNVVNIITKLRQNNPNAIFIGGGPCAMANPLPLANFFDAFVIGEIEGTNIMHELIHGKTDLDGVYYPKFDGVNKEDFRRIKRIYPKKITTEDYPTNQFTHPSGAYGNAFLLEIGRGCPRRCKFCMAKSIYYPPRFRKLDDLKYLVDEGLKHTKTNKIALISPSVGDYKHIIELCQYIKEKNENISISPSSLRADTIKDELLKILNLKTLTIAPEAGSERLREYIKKDISYEDISNALDIAKNNKIDKIKLYYMVGLPTETKEDIEEIITLSKNIKKNFRKVEISVNPFIPKPYSEFENEPFNLESKNNIKYIEKSLRKSNVKVNYENFNAMVIQCVLCRGGAELGNLLKNYNKPIQFLKYLKKNDMLSDYLM
ncbi:B12-binding domain-containing radical SAM protein [Methanothermococcus okinawensis]|uniref:Radical SAM domain protein n=1 Tax=Methanothermococcus okinawensis (strain DSM 14208 / JCM 11175 / IH1) TaxID=647113 RepID=F8ALW5_METOI|nr:radical SAM protein [Methanothermococcus okinawensis]AEH07542.1 Radical SAM domain protein [Methanothermococcus okinawensis IH1]